MDPASHSLVNVPAQGLYESALRPLLFRLDAERAHNLTLRASELSGRSELTRRVARRAYGVRDPRLRTTLAGIPLENPLGLAAGFDKNGRALGMLGAMGFGHLEIGSISAFPSEGNPRPRLFRIPQDRGIVVSYGVPNDGAHTVRRRLDAYRPPVALGVNLVKTNDPARPAVAPDVYEDYAASFELLQDRADYVALNLSCPNSPGDRDFFDELPRLDALLARLSACGPRAPVFLKLKPTRDAGVLREVVAIADGHPFVAGFAINLPAGKPPDLKLSSSREALERMPGAVGGPPVEEYVNAILATLYRIVGPDSRYALMAAGGVSTADDAYRKLRLGATVVQLYTGLVYRGPRVVKEILTELLGLLERDGFGSVAEVVGSADRS
jgi:dihydroorotate dehydrogenase